ncbi:MAG: hypothetical protein FWD49_02200 [Firmicutes bacterium]|nr:hypothetical protein [Bacillota bacterium]
MRSCNLLARVATSVIQTRKSASIAEESKRKRSFPKFQNLFEINFR